MVRTGQARSFENECIWEAVDGSPNTQVQVMQYNQQDLQYLYKV